ncbi:trehalose-phosphatase [Proteobacteria bacterium 005FR1]|nr:trehalose-phosphatase [Proteobacteria bacterium 005FR1]
MNRNLVSTGNDAPYQAVIADMDSVLTRMTSLHERAWQQVFNDYFQERNRRYHDQHAEFAHSDYRNYLDGKMRYPGAADFLRSRHIDLPFGDADDSPDEETVCGIGNRKEQVLTKLLESEGVAVFEDALAALRRWRLGGLKLAAISASCNCRNVLRLIKLENYLDVIVDGELARELKLNGKADLLKEAARQLDVDPENTLVLEDTAAGISAAAHNGFGLTVGVNRNHHGAELEDAGADAVVRSLSSLRFPRRLASAAEHIEDIADLRAGEPVALFLDFDGTLTPIVEIPAKAELGQSMRETVRSLVGICTVGIISGRDRKDLEARIGIEGILYAGSHGLDIAGPGYEKSLPEAEAAIPEVDNAERRLREALEGISGVIIERKRFSVAVHFRKVRSDVGIQQVKRVVDAVLADTTLRKRHGKMVLELEPAVEWDKGHAVQWLMETTEIDPERVLVIYIGDDETDEDVFAALAGQGVTLRVGEPVSDSLAEYHLAEPRDVEAFLKKIAERCEGREM